MKKPEDYKLGWAWDEDRFKAVHARLISELPNNNFICVDEEYEKKFLEGYVEYTYFSIWSHWSETDPWERSKK